MSSPFRLQPLVELAQDRSQAAAQTLGKLKLAWQEAENRLAQLQAYLDEYQAELQTQVQSGLSITQWRDYQAFIQKLEYAIQVQRQEVERLRLGWEAGQAEWLARERDVKAYQTLRQRHDTAERRRDEQQDQRLQDEFARNLQQRRND